jgi:hypothetical protein
VFKLREQIIAMHSDFVRRVAGGGITFIEFAVESRAIHQAGGKWDREYVKVMSTDWGAGTAGRASA